MDRRDEGSWDSPYWDDPVGHGRFAAIEGRVLHRPCRAKKKTFCLVYPKTTISVPDTTKYPWLRFILLRYGTEKTLNLSEISLDYMGRKILPRPRGKRRPTAYGSKRVYN